MKSPAVALTALLLLAGCHVDVDDNTAASIDNAAAGIENVADSAAGTVENVAEGAAGTVENAADKVGNTNIDVDVGNDRNKAAGNRQ
jgi:hypothetical protein